MLLPVSAHPVVNKPQNIHLLVVLGYKEWTLSGKPYEKCIYLLCTGCVCVVGRVISNLSIGILLDYNQF